MLIVVVGVNHRTAPVEIRERLAFTEQSLKDALVRLRSYPSIEGCVVLFTCNRTEIYITTHELDEGLHAVRDFLSHRSGVDISTIKNCTYIHNLHDAVRHLFRVAAGLDSMILGETQILGQVRSAYQVACEKNATDRVLNTLFQQAIAVGKRVRRTTGIDQNAISISYAAVELARQTLGELKGCSVLIIGAGKMSELAVRYLVANGVTGVIVSNRSFERALKLAGQFDGRAVKFNELYNYMLDADIVISCTAASHYVIHYQKMKEIMAGRPGARIMMIDIAVPRDIEPEIGVLPGVTLYDVDDLQNVVSQNLAWRKQAALIAEDIIEEELNQFMCWLGTQFVIPVIIALKNWAEQIKQKELRRAFNRLGELNPHDRKVVESLANSIVNQLLHVPITRLKDYALTSEGHLYARILQNLFNLNIKQEISVERKCQ